MSIGILLVDDHVLVREGIRSILQSEHDIVVVGEAGDGRAALQLVEELHPDIVVMDIAMPGLNGIEATRQITQRYPMTRLIALSTYSDKRYVLAMLEAGAFGYVVKESASDELLRAIRAVNRGQKYLSACIAGMVVDSYVKRDFLIEGSASNRLGSREREVLQLIAEGKSSPQIAAVLHISSSTVEAHRRNIMRKLDLHTIADLTKFAIREGLTAL
jgi:two-component system NarL family response regulator